MSEFPATLHQVEAVMADFEPAECPVVHRFTPGLYIRELHLPAGTLAVSMCHKIRHPFVISQGRIEVLSESEGAVLYEAPFTGITEPGTQRMVRVLEDTIWTTFHATEETDVEKIAAEILTPTFNPLLAADHPNRNQWKLQLPIPLI